MYDNVWHIRPSFFFISNNTRPTFLRSCRIFFLLLCFMSIKNSSKLQHRKRSLTLYYLCIKLSHVVKWDTSFQGLQLILIIECLWSFQCLVMKKPIRLLQIWPFRGQGLFYFYGEKILRTRPPIIWVIPPFFFFRRHPNKISGKSKGCKPIVMCPPTPRGIELWVSIVYGSFQIN